MDMIFNIKESILVAELFGELDHHAAQKVREDIDSTMETYDVSDLVFDFNKVSFMDSSGIGVILGRYRKLTPRGGRVVISCCSVSIRNILNMAGVFSIIDYFDKREDAISFLSKEKV